MTSPIDHHRQTRALLWDADIIDRQRKLANQLISLCTTRATLEDAPFVSLDEVDEHADEILSVVSKSGPCLETLYGGVVKAFGSFGRRVRKKHSKVKRPHRSVFKFILRAAGHPCKRLESSHRVGGKRGKECKRVYRLDATKLF